MDKNHRELVEEFHQLFDTEPYPINLLEQFPKPDVAWLYAHNLVSPYYLKNQKVIETEGKLILDAGCGNGYKSLAIAQANPGAKIIGIDLSEVAIGIAKQRLQYHGVNNVEFQVHSIDKLYSLPWKFDYINCDDVLYLLPNPNEGLKALKMVLKPDGIIRANLHSYLQRTSFFRSQRVFQLMGMMDENPGALEIELVRELMKSLKDKVFLKKNTWIPAYENNNEYFLTNYLLQGDKGYTIPEMFSILKTVELEFINLVNWRQWNLMDLFNEADNLPVFLGNKLSEISVEERLHLFELLHPTHRLLDFWCGHPDQAKTYVAVADWTVSEWQQAKVYLHPQLRTLAIKEELTHCIRKLQPFELSQPLPIAGEMATLDSRMAACLFPLWENAEAMSSLVERWQKLCPVHPVSLKPTTQEEAFEVVKQALLKLEAIGYVLLER